jgi:hypothetical protein
MAALNRKEIVTELKKIGITNTAELASCLKEYKAYHNLRKTPHTGKRAYNRLPVGKSIKEFSKKSRTIDKQL